MPLRAFVDSRRSRQHRAWDRGSTKQALVTATVVSPALGGCVRKVSYGAVGTDGPVGSCRTSPRGRKLSRGGHQLGVKDSPQGARLSVVKRPVGGRALSREQPRGPGQRPGVAASAQGSTGGGGGRDRGICREAVVGTTGCGRLDGIPCCGTSRDPHCGHTGHRFKCSRKPGRSRTQVTRTGVGGGGLPRADLVGGEACPASPRPPSVILMGNLSATVTG